MGLNDLTISAVELTVHVGDSALLGCVSKSTGEKHVTKVDWMFSSEEHTKVTRRKPCRVSEAPGQRCQNVGGGRIKSSRAMRWGFRSWVLELARTEPPPSLISWQYIADYSQLGMLLNLSELHFPICE